MSELYIGLMSGTSLDGADVVLVELDETECVVHAASITPFPEKLETRLRALVRTAAASLQELGTLDTALGEFFAECVRQLVAESAYELDDIKAIGHAGHTIYHKPAAPQPFSMQLGDPNVITAATGIDTVTDFRRTDMAHGGQGAPLTPIFHKWRFADPGEVRVVVNLGGVANITVLDPQQSLTGFDTGPANALMDSWSRQCWGERYDREGRRARQGNVNSDLLARLRADPYFQRQPPKSTGFEHFNMAWVEAKLAGTEQIVADEDVLRTLTELTAETVADAIRASALNCQRIILCGGGAFNTFLVERLGQHLADCDIESSAAHGIGPEWVEAVAFGWLARRRIEQQTGNSPNVTGARQTAILGSLYSISGRK